MKNILLSPRFLNSETYSLSFIFELQFIGLYKCSISNIMMPHGQISMPWRLTTLAYFWIWTPEDLFGGFVHHRPANLWDKSFDSRLQDSGEPEVADPDAINRLAPAEQDVVGLQVPMHNVFIVQVLDCTQDLFGYLARHRICNLSFVFYVAKSKFRRFGQEQSKRYMQH